MGDDIECILGVEGGDEQVLFGGLIWAILKKYFHTYQNLMTSFSDVNTI